VTIFWSGPTIQNLKCVTKRRCGWMLLDCMTRPSKKRSADFGHLEPGSRFTHVRHLTSSGCSCKVATRAPQDSGPSTFQTGGTCSHPVLGPQLSCSDRAASLLCRLSGSGPGASRPVRVPARPEPSCIITWPLSGSRPGRSPARALLYYFYCVLHNNGAGP
jgi:hypothetical protein